LRHDRARVARGPQEGEEERGNVCV
jgi:hypothetical protein